MGKQNQDSSNQPLDMERDIYAGDAPVSEPNRDLFRRWPFAQRIARVIATRQDPSSIVISVNGAWGEGKTTVLNFIEQELRTHPDVVSFRFNPWRFADEVKLLTNFFVSLAEAVGRSVPTTKEKIGEWVGKYLSVPASMVGYGDTAKSVGELLSSVELEELRERIETILRDTGKRVVVLMDDIDRLEKSEIQSLFRLVKLSADFAYTAYVLAFDDDMVAAALQERYSADSADAGRNFLEKIIQVPLQLPAIPKAALRNFCFTNVDQAIREAEIALSDNDVQMFIRHFTQGLEIRLRTPRMAKRYGNILTFSLPILKGEVHPVDLMLIEGVRVFYPDLYDVIRRYPDVFLGRTLNRDRADNQQKQRTSEIIEEGFKGLSIEERGAATRLLTALFPMLSPVFGGTHYGSDWEASWAREQRIASEAYFPRYFSYSIPEGEVSDQALRLFIRELTEQPDEQVSDTLVQLVGTQNAENILSKLRPLAQDISPDASQKLALAIVKHGDIFPHSQQVFAFLGPFSQAAMLVSDLIDNISSEHERVELAKQLLQASEPLPFTVEVFRWLKGDDEPEPKAFTSTQKEQLGKLVAERIKMTAHGNVSLFDQFPIHIARLMGAWAWLGSQADTDAYIKSLVEKEPSNALQLILGYLPTSYGLETGLTSKGDFERDAYNALARVVDPSTVYEALIGLFGQELTTEHYPRNYRLPVHERAAQQFCWVHCRALQEEKTQGNIHTLDSTEENDSEE